MGGVRMRCPAGPAPLIVPPARPRVVRLEIEHLAGAGECEVFG